MSLLSSGGGRSALVRDDRGLRGRPVRGRPEDDAGQMALVGAPTEGLRHRADDDDDPADTAYLSGFQSTSAIEFGDVESESAAVAATADDGLPADGLGRRPWPLRALVMLGAASALMWVVRAWLIRP